MEDGLQILMGDALEFGQLGIHPFGADGQIEGDVGYADIFRGLPKGQLADHGHQILEMFLVPFRGIAKIQQFFRGVAEVIKVFRIDQSLQAETAQQLQGLAGQWPNGPHLEALSVNFQFPVLFNAFPNHFLIKVRFYRFLHQRFLAGVISGLNKTVEINQHLGLIFDSQPLGRLALQLFAETQRGGLIQRNPLFFLFHDKGDLAGQGINP